jgi:hypothetical protein
VSDDQVYATVDQLNNFSSDQPCSRSLNKQHVSLGVFDKCCLLTNFLQENGRYEMIQRSWTIGVASLQYWDFLVDQLNLYTRRRRRSGYVGYIGVTEVRGD